MSEHQGASEKPKGLATKSGFYARKAFVKNKQNPDGYFALSIKKRMFMNTFKEPDSKDPEWRTGYEIAGWCGTESGTNKNGEPHTYSFIDVTQTIPIEEMREMVAWYDSQE